MSKFLAFRDRVAERVKRAGVEFDPSALIALITLIFQKISEVCAKKNEQRQLKAKARLARRLDHAGPRLRRQAHEMASEAAAELGIAAAPGDLREIANCHIDEACECDVEELGTALDECHAMLGG